MAGGDLARAADLIELAMPAMRQRREEDALRRWLDALPNELIMNRPVLSSGYVGVLLATGELDGVEDLLGSVERWLDATALPGDGPPGTVIVDEAMVPRLPAGIAMYRAAQARMLGDVPGTMAHASRALDLVAEDDLLGRGGAARCWDSRTGRPGISTRRTAGSPTACQSSSRVGTSPTWSGAQSRSPTSG